MNQLNTSNNSKREQEALLHIKKGNTKKAGIIYEALIEEGSKNHKVYGNFAVICGMSGEKNKMIELLKRALEIEPNYPQAHYNLGIALQEKGQLRAAIASYEKALKLRPQYPEALFSLGNAYKQAGDLDSAISFYLKALNHQPNSPDVLYNLGNALKRKEDFNGAISSYQRALKLNPNFSSALINLGLSLQEQGDLKGAISTYQEVLKLNPNSSETYWNLSYTQLLQGDYENGLQNYEWRWQINTPVILHGEPKVSQWKGSTLVSSQKMLVVSEQGLGDTIQYMRYLPYLQQQGVDILFSAQTKLHNLIKASGINTNPLSPDQASTVLDRKWIPLLSIPKYLGVTPHNPIIQKPYINSTVELKKKWKRILSKEKKTIIGINWQGNPKAEQKHQSGRSIPLEIFSMLLYSNEIKMLSLQKGFGSEQLDICSFKNKFVHCQSEINATWDFLENAAIIDNCDLIITSDTSIAHLAGGMGKPTWLLLKHVPEWRWGINGESTFWYPSMRLFRQKERNNWQEVMDRVSTELKFQISGKK